MRRLIMLPLLLVSCQTRAKECQEFIGTVNETLREIDARPQPKPDDVKALTAHRQALADKYKSLAVEVSRLQLTEPELVDKAKRYSGLAQDAGAALTSGVKALNAQDPKAAEASQREFDGVAKQEAALVREINDLCLNDN